MTQQEFGRGWDRLVKQWGKSTYTEERGALFWKAVQVHSPTWWMKTIDKFIGEYRQAPLMTELYEELAVERERNWHQEKRQHAQDAETSMREMLSPEDQGMLAQGIMKRLLRQMSDEDFANFSRMIAQIPKRLACRRCDGSGYVITDDNYAYRCPCPCGKKKASGIPEAS